MLTWILGRAIGDALGVKAAGKGWLRRRSVMVLRAALVDEVTAAMDAEAARVALGAHWRRVYRAWQAARQLGTAGDELRDSMEAQLRVFDGAALCDVPLVGLGLRQVAEFDDAPVWAGTPGMIIEAAHALAAHGYQAVIAGDREHVDVAWRGQRTATLLADPAFVVDPAQVAPRPLPSRAAVYLAWVALAATVVAMASGALVAAVGLAATAGFLALGHGLARRARRARARTHTARVDLRASAAPYRGAVVPELPAVDALVAALGAAGLPARRHDGAIAVEDVRLERVSRGVAIRFVDPARAMRCAEAIAAAAGPVVVDWAGRRTELGSAEDLATWLAVRQLDDARRLALCAAVAGG